MVSKTEIKAVVTVMAGIAALGYLLSMFPANPIAQRITAGYGS